MIAIDFAFSGVTTFFCVIFSLSPFSFIFLLYLLLLVRVWSPDGFDRAVEVTSDESPRVYTRQPAEDIPGSWLPVRCSFACTRCRRLASHSLPRTLEVRDYCDSAT